MIFGDLRMKKKEMIKRKNHIKQGFLEVCKTWFESHGTMRSSYTLLQFLRGAANPGLGHLIGDHDGHGLRNLGIFDGFFHHKKTADFDVGYPV